MKALEIGLMIWAAEAEAKINTMRALGLGVGQIGVRWQDIAATPKRRALAKLMRGSGIEWVTVFAAFEGENYSDIPSVRDTVGLVPPALRAQRLDEAKKLSEFACEVGVTRFALHVGFVPEDPNDPLYQTVVRTVRMLADECRFNGQQLCLETGQESADTMLRFIADVKCTNVRVNFDPANMVLYGSGEPIEALGKLAEYVVTVHCKDGKPPAESGKLGVEMPLGHGDVGMDRFIAKLKEIGYQGPLTIEREISGEQQIADVRAGIELLKRLVEPVAAEPAAPAAAAEPAPAPVAAAELAPAPPQPVEPGPAPVQPVEASLEPTPVAEPLVAPAEPLVSTEPPASP
ncbi:MAG: sugar phosphate isomerase/epimerase [Verrucomicrobia bacterium]|nr:sugar phosphate isomerase/epimerase [Verrucomicrobiota bacterium]